MRLNTFVRSIRSGHDKGRITQEWCLSGKRSARTGLQWLTRQRKCCGEGEALRLMQQRHIIIKYNKTKPQVLDPDLFGCNALDCASGSFIICQAVSIKHCAHNRGIWSARCRMRYVFRCRVKETYNKIKFYQSIGKVIISGWTASDPK